MHNVDEKYYDRISNKKKEADEYAKNILTPKPDNSKPKDVEKIVENIKQILMLELQEI